MASLQMLHEDISVKKLDGDIGYLPKGSNVIPLSKDDINSILYRSMARQAYISMNKGDKAQMLLGELIEYTKAVSGKE